MDTERDLMALVRLDCGRINDWESFHTVFAEVFHFPEYYGWNMDAWIDCMSDLGGAGEVITLHLDGVDEFAVKCPEQYAAIVECAAFVNWRLSSQGESAILALSYCKRA